MTAPGLGTPRVHLARTGSTNDVARELAGRGAPHGAVVTAGEQTAGRGRQGRAWVAPAGRALLLSLLLRKPPTGSAPLPLLAAVAVADAAEAYAPIRCGLKWPNDVWVGERKLAGILVEARPADGWAVVGIGLNVSTRVEELPAELRAGATSLAREADDAATTSPRASIDAVLALVLESIERRLAEPSDHVLDALRARDLLRGRTVRFAGGEGVAAGIDDHGHLLVETSGGAVALDSGEVHLRPMAR